ncbi:sugar ABC transporter permease [Thiospirochaeta perfilievii]|uniref:Sugar ABC transporter permease n=1 Tax=Thiospirochaeta perfilievii TaxID=252967 RepID=A0A5C1Q7J9_9SPIO|nr:sugar ABC transporter permease [Thiospirochaeta perfilievii]QEN04053.1 sugar ABC transporter permease [Thiospirochaeta perfilievii]
MNNILSNKKVILLFMLPATLIFLFVVIAPIFTSGYYSSLEWNGIGKGTFIGFSNFKELLFSGNKDFYKPIINSLWLALLSVGIQLPIAFFFARLLTTGVRGEGFFRTVYFIPVIVSTVVIGNMWMKIYNPQYGVLNEILRNIGLEHLTNQWLGNKDIALVAVFVPLLWQFVGYHILLFYAGIKTLPQELIEAAQIDGASPLKITFSIIIPYVLPIIEICVILAVIGSLKTFDLIYILTGGGPLHSTEVPTTIMFNTIFHRMSYGYGSSMAIFIIAECLILTVLVQGIFGKLTKKYYGEK